MAIPTDNIRSPGAPPVLGARRSAGRARLPASGRSDQPGAGSGRLQGIAARDLGMDLRNRITCVAVDFRRAVRPLPARPRWAGPSWRDAAIFALALRQPRRTEFLCN